MKEELFHILKPDTLFNTVSLRLSLAPSLRLSVSPSLPRSVSPSLRISVSPSLLDFAPEPPAIRNFLTGEIMGSSSDRLAARFGVSREEQDEFALRSHVNAGAAHAAGHYKDAILPFNGSQVCYYIFQSIFSLYSV